MLRSLVELDVVSFHPLSDGRNAQGFLEILEDIGGIFVPEVVEKGHRKIRYREVRDNELKQVWTPSGLLLKTDAGVRIPILIQPDDLGALLPNKITVYVPKGQIRSRLHLNRLVELGNRIYDFMLPCYGFITLPWMEPLRVVLDPDRGLPGWGWATWLGPEYEDLVDIPSENGLSVTSLADGGRLFLCGWPEVAGDEDPNVLSAYELVMRRLNPDVLQPLEGRARRVPTFRFRSKASGLENSKDPAATKKGSYGPGGYTRTNEIRAVLDKYEPKYVEDHVNDIAGAVYFIGLTPEDAQRLLKHLPPEQADDSLEASPSFGQMVEFGKRFPHIRFFGHRIKPEWPGECITIEGFFLPEDDVTEEAIAAIESYQPERMEWTHHEGRRVLHVQWD